MFCRDKLNLPRSSGVAESRSLDLGTSVSPGKHMDRVHYLVAPVHS